MYEDAQTEAIPLDSPYVDLAVEVFAMLADATRVRIVVALRDRELAVGELAELLGKAPTAVSQHLAKLRMARIVVARQDGNRVYYRLAGEHAVELVTAAIFQAEHAGDAQPPHHAKDRA